MSTTPQSHDEPTGVCLKAAYLALREMGSDREPPTMERVAGILQNTLRYSYLVSVIEQAYEKSLINGSTHEEISGDLRKAHEWISNNLH